MHTPKTTCILFLTGILACSGSSSSDAPPENGRGGVPGGGDATQSAYTLNIVFNEVAAVGKSEWIEIVNPTQTVVDISNFSIADSSKGANSPKVAEAMKFPGGTKMDPGARIVILTSKKAGSVGPHSKAECLPDGPETCFFATFGVSATKGEVLHVLAPDNSVVTSTAIPKSASADAGGSTTETRCRIPDLTGDFTTCPPTPGQPNHAP